MVGIDEVADQKAEALWTLESQIESFWAARNFETVIPVPTDPAKRVETIAELCREGFGKQMVLSHDACCHIDFYPDPSMRSLVPLWNFRHIPDDVVPALRKAGVPEEDIRAMTVENPRRIFEAHGAY